MIGIPLSFDHIYYLNNNSDVKNAGYTTREQAYNHWINYGKKEGRKCNTYVSLPIKNKTYSNKINILIRNTYRPVSFSKCMKSILNQNYSNINIICCYDDIKCLDYLNTYNQQFIEKFYISIPDIDNYKYNLYCNTLIEKIKDGWFMFLDDDDQFINNHALHSINSCIEDDDDMILWKFKHNNITIFPECISDIKPSQIASSTYCFNHKFKSLGKWTTHQLGDYEYINKVLMNHKFNRKFINYALTGTSYNGNFGNYGKKE